MMLERLIIVVNNLSDSDGPATERDPVLSAAAWELFAREFPDVQVEIGAPEVPPGELAVTVLMAEWKDPAFDLRALDSQVAQLSARGPVSLCLAGPSALAAGIGQEVLTRYQRFIDRRNHASTGPVFDRVLSAHRELHDLHKPLVRADYDHALDTWRWMLRLDESASLAAQVAALFHDVERLVSEADARIEHQARSYQEFKDAHAQRGAALARAALASAGIDDEVIDRVDYLIRWHERPQLDVEIALLNDADALSFFSLNSAGFMDYFGPEHTRRKVVYTWRRLRPEARARLGQIRYRADVLSMVMEQLPGAREGGAPADVEEAGEGGAPADIEGAREGGAGPIFLS
jgi:hypothetical protein